MTDDSQNDRLNLSGYTAGEVNKFMITIIKVSQLVPKMIIDSFMKFNICNMHIWGKWITFCELLSYKTKGWIIKCRCKAL